MKEIPLTQGYVALVDDEDYDRITAHGKWHVSRRNKSLTADHTSRNPKKQLLMHREVFNNPEGTLKPIDGSHLNCQKANFVLRPRGFSYTNEYICAATRKVSAINKHKYYIKSHYNLDYKKFVDAVGEQKGVCKICGRPSETVNLCVDHDHACCPGSKSCGKCVRDLLCRRCNILLGFAADDIGLLETCIDYLKAWKDKTL